MPPMFNPLMFFVEIGYTFFILFFCFLIYIKTKEIYDLTKHKGIYYFRNTFLFFGLAYLLRFLFGIIMMTERWIDFIHIPRHAMRPLTSLFTGYFSTMALLCLIYSTIWKRFSSKEFFIASNIIALLIAVSAAISQEVFILTQIFLLIIAIVLSIVIKKKSKLSKIHILYFLLFLFWIISLILLIPRWMLPLEIRIIMEIISIALFAALYYKVTKWTK